MDIKRHYLVIFELLSLAVRRNKIGFIILRLMGQKYEEDLFKIIKIRKQRKNIHQINKVSLLISPQILQASQVIKANQSQSNKRIKHKSTQPRERYKIMTPKIEVKRQKWQSSLNAYIEAKSKIHNKDKINNTITFFNLDRLNRNRYEQLISKQFASLKISRNLDTIMHNQQSHREPFKSNNKIQNQNGKVRLHSDRLLKAGQDIDEDSKNYSRYGRLNLGFMKTYSKRKSTRQEMVRRRNIETLDQSILKSSSINSQI